MLAAIAAPASMVAQAPAPGTERVWLAVGSGLGAMEEVAAAASVDLAYQRGAHLFALHSTGVLGGYELSHVAGSVGLVYGRASSGTEAPGWSVAAGLAFVQVDISGRELENTLGIPITAQASLDSPVVGVALVGFANLNPAESYAGVVLSLRVGRLRRLSRSRGPTARARGRAAARTPRRYPDLATRAPRR